jgi:large subunit ribosomal protein L15
MKGQKPRGSISPIYEGGQLPLVKRLPYMRGFHNPFRVSYTAVNLNRLEGFDPQSAVTPETLRQAGIVRKQGDLVKILGVGELAKPLNVTAHAFSRAAKERIEAAGGTATVIATGKSAEAQSG